MRKYWLLWARLLDALSCFFPEYDSIIYSDVDGVFMDDVSEQADVDLTDMYIVNYKSIYTIFVKQ